MAATEPPLNATPASPEDKTIFNLLSNIKDQPDTIKTVIRVDPDDDIVILKRDPETHQSVINKSAYLRLHKTLSPESSSTVDKIKVKYEQEAQKGQPEIRKSETIESLKNKYSPSGLGYTGKPPVTPRKSRLTKSQILVSSKREYAQRRSLNIEPKKNKDVNSNDLQNSEKNNEDDDEYITIITRSDSEESVHKFEKELSVFTMDKKKRSSSFRKIFAVFSNKEKKKKNKAENIQNGDNLHNESTFSRQVPYRHTTAGNDKKNINIEKPKLQRSDSDPDEIGRKMELLLSEGLPPVNNLQRNPNTGYTTMDKPLYNTYTNVPPIRKFIDTSSSASTLESNKSNIHHQNSLNKPNQSHEDEVEVRPNSFRPNRISDGRRDTPPRLMETIKQDVRLVNPKALIPINSERPLPNPYQNGNAKELSPNDHSLSRNKPFFQSTPTSPNQRSPFIDENYGTVFDSLDNRQRSLIQKNSPVEGSKLKLPPNREIVPLSPRVKSPIPSDSVSTDKIIATELLKNKQETTPTKERVPSQQRLNFDTQRDYSENMYNNQSPRNDIPVVKPPVPGKIINPPEPDSRRTSQTRSSNESVVLRHPQTPNQYLSNQSIALRRPMTPSGNPIPDSPKTTPQKDDIRKSVEAYYWKEIKKLKDQENYQLYLMQMQYGYTEEPLNVRRSRSMSPVASRTGRRSMSLPRDGRPPPNVMPEPLYPQMIPENRAVVQPRSMQQLQFQQQQQQQQQQYFQRNAPERSTIDGVSPRKMMDGTNSLYKPIFKRGSLSTPPRQAMEDSLKRKVSFSSQDQNVQVWPTRNGYTQSPPQRRLEKMQGNPDDEVFLPNSPLRRNEENLYYNAPRQSMGEPGYVLRASQNSLYLHQRQPIEHPHRVRSSPSRQQDLYGQPLDVVRPLPLSRHGSIQIQEELYGQRPIPRRVSYQTMNPSRPLPAPPQQEMYQLTVRRPNGMQLPPPRREIIVNDEIFGEFGGYYSSNTQRQDNVRVLQYYPPKQVTVSNKACDIYGQIHDLDREKNIQQSGVILGQVRRPQENFVRNSRLTSSANDMYRKMPQNYPNETLYGRIEQNGAPNRPLPPVPFKKNLVSDTESVSDASEVQRIMNNNPKTNKKRGIFGK